MLLDDTLKQLATSVAAKLHTEKTIPAAQEVAEHFKIRGLKFRSTDDPEKAHETLTGFLHNVMEYEGGLEEAAKILWSPNQFTPHPSSVKQVWDLFETSNMGLIMGAARMGKCSDPNDLCRLSTGKLIRIGDVKVGDTLAGDDGTSRKVLSITRGRAPMFRIKAKNLVGFSCNGDHILVLVCSISRKNNRGGKISSGYTRGTVVKVPLSEYLTWSAQKKRYYKMLVNPCAMPESVQKVDPYIYGAWLGDGTRCRCELTSPDGPMVRRWCEYWEDQGFIVRERAPITWSVQDNGKRIWPNQWVKESVLVNEKRIRDEYKFASETQRLMLLAGIIDADGTPTGGGFDLVSKWETLADDIEEVARSLGFTVHRHARPHKIKARNFSAIYHHVIIQGDCTRIPTLEKRPRKTTNRGLLDGHPMVSFEIETLGEGEYAGFTLDGNHRFLMGDGIVAHNSYSMGVRLFLEWVRDPQWTSIRVVGPSENHLEENLFSHLVALHQHATLPMPGTVGDLFIGLDRRNQLSSLRGVVIPKGNSKKAGRLQGGHRKPRPESHPIFGPLSRLFLFLDEIENIPDGIWLDIDNVLSEISEDKGGFKIFGAFNPTDLSSKVAQRAEPAFGWNNLDPDIHFRWKSVRGWDVIRIDGERCENVVQGKVIYQGLQTREGLEKIAANAGGRQGNGYQTMGRGLYPSQSLDATVVPPGMFPKWRGEYIWYREPEPVSATDLALEGGDDAIHTIGLFGLATGIKYPPSLDFPKGHTVMFKDTQGRLIPRWGAQANQQFVLPRAETVGMKTSILDMNRKTGTKGLYYACDRTGHGAGVADLMKYEWSSQIHDVNYSSGAGKEKIMIEDSKTCEEQFERMYSVLWFALRQWGEFGYFLISPQMDLSKLAPQITGRRFRVLSGKSKVESKKDYESRGFKSPNEADSLTLFVHAARKGSGLVLSMRGNPVDLPSSFSFDALDDWPTPGGEQRIDASNTTDFLDTSMRTPGSMADDFSIL